MRLLLRFWLCILLAVPVLAEEMPAEERARIDYLLQAIASLDGAVFVRNGKAHTPAEASAHLAMKLGRASNSFFAPDASRWTAEMFIDRLASKSSLTGEPYLIRFDSGEERLAGEWLHQQLERYSSGD